MRCIQVITLYPSFLTVQQNIFIVVAHYQFIIINHFQRNLMLKLHYMLLSKQEVWHAIYLMIKDNLK